MGSSMDSKMDSLLKAIKEIRSDMNQWMAAMENQWNLQQNSVIELEQDYGENPIMTQEYYHQPAIICNNPEEKFPDLDQDNNPREWVRSCNEYFLKYRIPENLKMDYLASHVKGKIDGWDHEGMVSWADFSAEICRGFEDFCKGKGQNGHKCNVRNMNAILGLKETQESSDEEQENEETDEGKSKFSVDICRRFEDFCKGKGQNGHYCKGRNMNAILGLKETQESNDDEQENEEICRRFEDLKGFCKGEGQNGHYCNGRTNMNAIIGHKETQESSDDEEQEDDETDEGNKSIDTIKLLGKVNEKFIVILIDTGSTHSFLNPQIVMEMGLKWAPGSPVLVTVANGDQMICDLVCPKFKWTVQGEPFEKDIMLLKMNGCKCDMVLGMDWVDEFAPVQLDTRPLGLSFNKGNRRITLYGIIPGSELKKSSM